MDTFRLPTTADIHLPAALIGKSLSWSKEKGKGTFEIIKKNIEVYYASAANLESLMKIVDDIDQTKSMGNAKSMKILYHVISYLRIKLLSRVLREIEMTAVLVDVLVKNCQYRVHIYVGKRIFMKTFCQTVRQLLGDEKESHRCVGVRMLDILQGWGEAFSTSRHEIYPDIVASYEKMRYKYGYVYPRPDFDDTRVPIFLGPINSYELSVARNNLRMGGLSQVGEGGKHRQRPVDYKDLESPLNYDNAVKEAMDENDDDFTVDDESVASPKDFLSSKVLPLIPISTDMMTFEEIPMTMPSSHALPNYPPPLPPTLHFREGFVSEGISHYNSTVLKDNKSTRILPSSPHILPEATSPLLISNSKRNIKFDSTIGTEINIVDPTISTALINYGTLPTPYYSTTIDPYYGGITRGLKSPQSIAVNKSESERLSAMINMDIKKMMEDMKTEEKHSPALKVKNSYATYDSRMVNSSKDTKEQIGNNSPVKIAQDRIQNSPEYKGDSRVVKTHKDFAEQISDISKMGIVGDRSQEPLKNEGVSGTRSLRDKMEGGNSEFDSADTSAYCSNMHKNTEEKNVEDNEIIKTVNYVVVTPDAKEPPIASTTSFAIINETFEIDMDDALMLSPSGHVRSASYACALNKPKADPEILDCEGSNSDGKDFNQEPRKKCTNGMCPPSSDPEVEVKYFGHQRIVVKKR